MNRSWIPTKVKLRADVTWKGKTHWKGTVLDVIRVLENGQVTVCNEGFNLRLHRADYEIVDRRRINGKGCC